MAKVLSRQQLLAHVEPHYFLDYAIFTGKVRHYTSITLEAAFKADPSPVRRGLHFVNILKEEYAAYEDVGAFLKAFLDYGKGKVDLPIARLLEYRPNEVILAKIFTKYRIPSGQELYNLLNLDDWIPAAWEGWFPHLNLRKALRLACDFFFGDCSRNQKEYGVVAYNKIKHGLLVVPSGQRYMAQLPDAPAVIFPTDAKRPERMTSPYTIYGFKIADSQIEERHKAIEFVQCNLRLLAALYVVWRYPSALAARSIPSSKALFESEEFHDVRHLIGEITAKN